MLIHYSTISISLFHIVSSFYIRFIILSYIFRQRFLFLDQLSLPFNYPPSSALYHNPPPKSAPSEVQEGRGIEGEMIGVLILIFIV